MALSSGLDYSLTTEEVYQKVAEVFLKPSDHCSLLHYSAAFRPEQADQSTLPSWVPDWRFRARFQPLIHPSFECGFDTAGEFAISDDGTLGMRGFIYQYVGNDELLQLSSVKQLADIFKATETLLDKDYSKEINLLRTRTIHGSYSPNTKNRVSIAFQS